jgi:hypothetical protein
LKARSAPAYNLLLVSERRFSIRGISRVTEGYFITLFAFYSLVSSVTYLQILTTNLFCGKFYKFQFLKKSLVWKFCNKPLAQPQHVNGQINEIHSEQHGPGMQYLMAWSTFQAL